MVVAKYQIALSAGMGCVTQHRTICTLAKRHESIHICPTNQQILFFTTIVTLTSETPKFARRSN